MRFFFTDPCRSSFSFYICDTITQESDHNTELSRTCSIGKLIINIRIPRHALGTNGGLQPSGLPLEAQQITTMSMALKSCHSEFVQFHSAAFIRERGDFSTSRLSFFCLTPPLVLPHCGGISVRGIGFSRKGVISTVFVFNSFPSKPCRTARRGFVFCQRRHHVMCQHFAFRRKGSAPYEGIFSINN